MVRILLSLFSPSFPSLFGILHTRTVVYNGGGASHAAYTCGSGVYISLPSPHTLPPALFILLSDFVFLHFVYIHHSLHTRLCSVYKIPCYSMIFLLLYFSFPQERKVKGAREGTVYRLVALVVIAHHARTCELPAYIAPPTPWSWENIDARYNSHSRLQARYCSRFLLPSHHPNSLIASSLSPWDLSVPTISNDKGSGISPTPLTMET